MTNQRHVPSLRGGLPEKSPTDQRGYDLSRASTRTFREGHSHEIYVFCKDIVWANYEAIQADIFDHILAIVPEFDPRFQEPAGADFSALTRQ